MSILFYDNFLKCEHTIPIPQNYLPKIKLYTLNNIMRHHLQSNLRRECSEINICLKNSDGSLTILSNKSEYNFTIKTLIKSTFIFAEKAYTNTTINDAKLYAYGI